MRLVLKLPSSCFSFSSFPNFEQFQVLSFSIYNSFNECVYQREPRFQRILFIVYSSHSSSSCNNIKSDTTLEFHSYTVRKAECYIYIIWREQSLSVRLS